MGCSSCGNRAAAAAKYPRDITLSDGTTKTVTSSAEERTERARAQQRERDAARARGYSVQRGN